MKTKMNLCKLIVCCVVMLFSVANSVKADSPLTSTGFYVVYKDLPVFEDSLSMYKYLLDDDVAVEKRLAVINRSGWNIDGQNHSTVLLNILAQKFEKNDLFAILGELSGYQLICVAYLKALDDYFNVEEAMLIAAAAEAKEPLSYSVNIIAALIRAQYAMDYNWGALYLCMDNVRNNKNLNEDMRPEASSIIFQYTDLYKSDVK